MRRARDPLRGPCPFFMGVREVQAVQNLLELERLKEEYSRLERRGIPMSVREWYERALAEIRRRIREERRGKPGKRLGELLVEQGIIDQVELQNALAEQRRQGGRKLLGEVLMALGLIKEETLFAALRTQENEN